MRGKSSVEHNCPMVGGQSPNLKYKRSASTEVLTPCAENICHRTHGNYPVLRRNRQPPKGEEKISQKTSLHPCWEEKSRRENALRFCTSVQFCNAQIKQASWELRCRQCPNSPDVPRMPQVATRLVASRFVPVGLLRPRVQHFRERIAVASSVVPAPMQGLFSLPTPALLVPGIFSGK